MYSNMKKSFGLGDVQRLEIMRYMKTPCDGRGQLEKANGHYYYSSLPHAICVSLSQPRFAQLLLFTFLFFFSSTLENFNFSEFFHLKGKTVLH